jgi:hypothetical protein
VLAPTPSSQYDVERATWTPLQGSPNGHALEAGKVGVRYICRRDDPVLIDNRLSALQITDPSLEMLDKDTPPAMPTATASTSRIPDSEEHRTIAYSLILMLNVIRKATNPPSSLFNDLASVSCGPPVREEGMTDTQPNEELATTTAVPRHVRILSSFTLYGQLSVACTPEEFASLRSRLQQEWSFDGGFVS